MLDITRVNSQTIVSLNRGMHPRNTDSFNFAWDLAMALVFPHIQRRRVVSGLQKKLTDQIDTMVQYLQIQLGNEGHAGDGAGNDNDGEGDDENGNDDVAEAGEANADDHDGECTCWDLCVHEK